MKNILIVDDDELFISTLTKMLRKTYNVVSFEDTAEAISYIQSNDNIDLVITDLRMPSINGVELSKIIHEINPDIKTLLVSAYPKEYLQSKVIENNIPVVNYIRKPIFKKDIDEIINEDYNYDEVDECIHSETVSEEEIDSFHISEFYNLEHKWGDASK